MLLELFNRISSERKVKKRFRRHFRTSKKKIWCHFRTSPGCQIRTSPGRQIGTSPGGSNRNFRGRPRDVGGERLRDVLGTNICRLGKVRSSRPEPFCKKGVLRNVVKFTGKHLCQSLFFNKAADLRCPSSLKQDSGTGVFL